MPSTVLAGVARLDTRLEHGHRSKVRHPPRIGNGIIICFRQSCFAPAKWDSMCVEKTWQSQSHSLRRREMAAYKVSYPRQCHELWLLRVISCLTIFVNFVVAAAVEVESLVRVLFLGHVECHGRGGYVKG
jgi:hypothetical protein